MELSAEWTVMINSTVLDLVSFFLCFTWYIAHTESRSVVKRILWRGLQIKSMLSDVNSAVVCLLLQECCAKNVPKHCPLYLRFRRVHFTAEGSISFRIIGLIFGPFMDKVLLSSAESLPAFCYWDGQRDMNSALELPMLSVYTWYSWLYIVVLKSPEM